MNIDQDSDNFLGELSDVPDERAQARMTSSATMIQIPVQKRQEVFRF